MYPGPCRRDLGFEDPISPPRTKGGEIKPPNLALDMVRDADEYMMKKDPFPPEGRGPAEKQSEKKQPRNKIKSQTRGKRYGRSPYTNMTAGRKMVRGVSHFIFLLSPGPVIPFPYVPVFAGVMSESSY